MHSRTALALPAVLVLAILTALSDAVSMQRRIVFDSPRPLLTARLDPNISPGIVSQHVHRIIGGSNFDGVYNRTKLRQSKCSSMAPQSDLSNYWHPSVLKVVWDPKTNTTRYSPIWAQTRIYYNFPDVRTDRPAGSPGTIVEPFPDDFQMVAGNPGKKVGGRYLQEDLSIFYYCEQDFKNGTIRGVESFDFPKNGCSVLVSKVWFPSCWNGQPYDYANPLAHVRYPLLGAGLLGPFCPTGFERRIPSILVESFHFLTDFGDGPYGPWGSNGPDMPTFILANGDTTGFGLHADFANGWDTGVLAKVVTDCVLSDFDLNAGQSCPALTPTWSYDTANACLLDANTKVPAETMGWEGSLNTGTLAALPGCNKVWGSTGPKPQCPGYQDPKLVKWSRLSGRERNEEASPADIAAFGPSSSAIPSSSTAASSTAATASGATTTRTGVAAGTTTTALTATTQSQAQNTTAYTSFVYTYSYPVGNTTLVSTGTTTSALTGSTGVSSPPVAGTTTTEQQSATLPGTTVAITYEVSSIDTAIATTLAPATTLFDTTTAISSPVASSSSVPVSVPVSSSSAAPSAPTTVAVQPTTAVSSVPSSAPPTTTISRENPKVTTTTSESAAPSSSSAPAATTTTRVGSTPQTSSLPGATTAPAPSSPVPSSSAPVPSSSTAVSSPASSLAPSSSAPPSSSSAPASSTAAPTTSPKASLALGRGRGTTTATISKPASSSTVGPPTSSKQIALPETTTTTKATLALGRGGRIGLMQPEPETETSEVRTLALGRAAHQTSPAQLMYLF